jgi:hypothetical protein
MPQSSGYEHSRFSIADCRLKNFARCLQIDNRQSAIDNYEGLAANRMRVN